MLNLLLTLLGYTADERRQYHERREAERRVKMIRRRYNNFW